MILIFSQLKDPSTQEVIDWLNSYGLKFTLIDEKSVLGVKVDINDGVSIITDNHQTFKISNYSAFWYRRGELKIKLKESLPDIDKIKEHLNIEWSYLSSYISEQLMDLPSLGNPLVADNLNKLQVLKEAQNVGLKVPKTIVTGNKNDLIELIEGCGSAITKGIHRNPAYQMNGYSYSTFTKKISLNSLEELPETFFPSLFQEEVKKKFELRVFYLDGKCYSMAIFSNLEESSSVDWRANKSNFPLRTSPFQLPKEIEEKLQKLMHKVDLNCGSVDLMLNQSNEYVFLEINPVGQYHNLSKRCNYHLDREIAKHLGVLM